MRPASSLHVVALPAAPPRPPLWWPLVLLAAVAWLLSASSERWVEEHFTRDGLLWRRRGP